MTDCTEALATYARYFESLTPDRLDGLDALFAPGARFKDPFNDVTGIDAIRGVFAHMYRTLESPRFEVLDSACRDDVGYLHWRFLFQRGGEHRCIIGLSRVVFDAQLRVLEHVDHWDPADQVYASIPLLGGVLRWLRARLSAAA